MLSNRVSHVLYLDLAETGLTRIYIVSSMPDGLEHPETWVFHLAMAWLGDPDHSLGYKERLALIKERAKDLAEPARSAFTWIPEDTPVHKADISHWITQPWNNREGRITLVGDAAHPMPPCKCGLHPHLMISTMAISLNFQPLTSFFFQTAVKVSTTAFAIFPTSSTPFNAFAPTRQPSNKQSRHTTKKSSGVDARRLSARWRTGSCCMIGRR